MPKLNIQVFLIKSCQKFDVIEENQQHHWIQYVEFYKEQLKFFQLQNKLKFVGQCNNK